MIPVAEASRLWSRARTPAGTVLAGRAVAQLGIFALSFLPVVVLSQPDYNDLIAALTVATLVVVAPAGAFQQHLVRQADLIVHPRRAVAFNVALAVPLAILATLLLGAFAEWRGWFPAMSLAGVSLAIGAAAATSLAVASRFGASAAVEAVPGALLVAASVVLVVVGGEVVAWVLALLATAAVGAWMGWSLLGRGADGTAEPTTGFWRLVLGARSLIAIGVLAMAYNRVDYLILVQVASDREATRYAVAARLVGPALIVLGSLNNSLYPQLLALRPDVSAMLSTTGRYARLLVAASTAYAPLAALGAYAVGLVSDSLRELDLVPLTFVLGLAVVPFAMTVPFSFLLTALGRERWFLAVLLAGVVVDATLVVLLGHRGAMTCALIWLGVQLAVVAVLRVLVATAANRHRHQ